MHFHSTLPAKNYLSSGVLEPPMVICLTHSEWTRVGLHDAWLNRDILLIGASLTMAFLSTSLSDKLS